MKENLCLHSCKVYFCGMDRLVSVLYFLQHRMRCIPYSQVHSPFLFSLIQEVLQDKRQYYLFDRLQQERQILLTDKHLLEIEDHGAGSRTSGFQRNRSVSSIARQAVISPAQGAMLFRLVRWGGYHRILELGTSLGLSAAYMAGAGSKVTVDTIEGSPAIAKEALSLWQKTGISNISLHTGTFDEQLPELLNKPSIVFDLVYIDGNHRMEPTLRYVDMITPYLSEKSVVVLDDIHWSKEMHQAWQILQSNQSFCYSVDLFYKGLLFREPGLQVHQSASFCIPH